jgi:hypothetical protein
VLDGRCRLIRFDMGQREETLRRIFGASGETVPVPRKRHLTGEYRAEAELIYARLGGNRNDFPLNLRKWDMTLHGVAVELDEQLHFNRYRLTTLDSPLYQQLPHFPLATYRGFCIDHEADCLKAGSYGGKWTNDSCEEQFGPAGTHGDLTGRGAPRWKQRAFYDFVKDLFPLATVTPVVRVAIWDEIEVTEAILTVGEALDRSIDAARQPLLELVQQRLHSPNSTGTPGRTLLSSAQGC